MSLASELDGAELVVGDEDLGLLFVWYGGAGVQILDEQGNARDYFSISTAFNRKLSAREVRSVIKRYRAAMLNDDES